MIEVDGVKVYSLEEAAKIMGLHKITVRKYLQTGALKGKKAGGQWRITEQSIRAFLTGDKNA